MREQDIEKLNLLDIRVAVMEVTQKNMADTIDHHGHFIDKLALQGSEMQLTLQEISGKFDTLIAQFRTGFKTVSIIASITVVLVSAFWTYNKNLEDTYMRANVMSLPRQTQQSPDK